MKHKNILKFFAVAVSMIGVGTAAFHMATDAVMAASLTIKQSVPTSYQVPAAVTAEVPQDYQKAEYYVLLDDLNQYNPTATDLTMEEAAELGAQYLWKVYELDLAGANIFMYYSPGSKNFPRAEWSGDVLFSDKQTPDSTRWTFSIDAVTGELFRTGFSERLKEEVSLAADAGLEHNYSVYDKLAREYAERCDFMSGPVSMVVYNSQGYTLNNPDASFEVLGENGEKVLMTFSRYDQKLLGVITNSATGIGESAADAEPDEMVTEMAN